MAFVPGRKLALSASQEHAPFVDGGLAFELDEQRPARPAAARFARRSGSAQSLSSRIQRSSGSIGSSSSSSSSSAAGSKASRRAVLGFASVSMAGGITGGEAPAGTSGKEPRGPVFTIAAVKEKKKGAAAPAGVPAWRVAAGNVAAGAVAGATVEAVLYPIDTMKTRLQAMNAGGGIRALLQAGGGKALYAGVFGNLAGAVPASAIFMGVYEPVKKAVLARVSEERSYLAPIAGGAAAGLASSIVRVPTEVIKQRMQTGEFTRALGAVRSVVAKEGLRGMYAGYGPFLLRDLPFDAIQFVMYEQMRRAVTKLKGGAPPDHFETSAIGAAAGASTGLLTTPLDVIKTRLMTQGARGTYRGVVDCATKIAREEGAAALFRGWEPRVLWIGVGGCVFFTALEEAKAAFAPKQACCGGGK